MKRKSAVAAALPHTIPVLTGYIFLGIAFGLLLQNAGWGPLWAAVMGVFIYAGSMQFVAVALLSAGFDPWMALLMTLMVNARHIFYGISMLERYKDYRGFARFYMIFSLTDETFALLCSAKPPEGVAQKPFALAISALDQLYWVIGCGLGGLIGATLPINTQGIEFVMTALFVVILLEQWQTRGNRLPAAIGLCASVLCRLLLGPDWFILGAMAVMVVIFTALRTPFEKRQEGKTT